MTNDEGKELFAAFLRVGNPEVEHLALRYHDYWKARLETAESALQSQRQLTEEAEARAERAEEIAAMWCWNPDAVGRSCGECENCQRHEKLLDRAESLQRQVSEYREAASNLVEAVENYKRLWTDNLLGAPTADLWKAAREARAILTPSSTPEQGT